MLTVLTWDEDFHFTTLPLSFWHQTPPETPHRSSNHFWIITNPAGLLLWSELQSPQVHSREGNGTPLQHSCLENPMGGEAWWAAVHRVTKSQTRLSDFTFTFHFHALEKEMAAHSSVLAWRIPGMGEPGGLPSMGPHRVGHNWSNLAPAASSQAVAPNTWEYDYIWR